MLSNTNKEKYNRYKKSIAYHMRNLLESHYSRPNNFATRTIEADKKSYLLQSIFHLTLVAEGFKIPYNNHANTIKHFFPNKQFGNLHLPTTNVGERMANTNNSTVTTNLNNVEVNLRSIEKNLKVLNDQTKLYEHHQNKMAVNLAKAYRSAMMALTEHKSSKKKRKSS